MIKRPTDWDKIDGVEFGDYETLELGGHEVVIKNAYEYTGQTGNTSLKIEVDIAGNDKQAGFFQKQYDNNNNADKKWPNGAVKYVSLKEEKICLEMFKGFTTAVENSNPGYTWDWNEESLIGKKICGVFGLEQYQKQDGTTGMATKLDHFRSLDKLAEVKVPQVKFLDGSRLDYEQYKNVKNSGVTEIKGDKIDEFIDNNLSTSSENMLD